MKVIQVLRGFVGLVFVVAVAAFLNSCVLAIPAVVHYYQSQSNYVASAEVRGSAEEIYRTAIKEAEARAPEIKIIKRDDAERKLEITDGVETASFLATQLSDEVSQIFVLAKSPEGAKKEKELALRIIEVLCESLGVDYTVTQKGIVLPDQK